MLEDAPLSVQKMFNKIWAEMESARVERIKREAHENPTKHRDCTVFPKGARYHYYRLKGTPKGKTLDFCYSQHPNAAGYYVTWIEVTNGSGGYRTNFHGWETKRDAMDECRTRLRDAEKPKAERKYTLPPWRKKR